MDIQLQPGKQLIRLPAYAPADERTQTPYGAGTAEGHDQMLINMIPSRGADGSWVADKRAGLTRAGNTINTLSHLGSCGKDNICMTTVVDVNVAAIFDASVNKIYIIQYLPAAGGGGTPDSVKIGEIAGANVKDWCFLTELMIGTTPTLGVIWTKYDKSTSKGFYASTAAGVFPASSLTEITGAVDPDFPTNTPAKVVTGPFVQFKQCTYIMTTDGYIYNSDEGSITSWNTLANTAAQAYPDKGIGLCRFKNYLAAFGEDSIEFFGWVNNPPPGSPLQPADQAFIKFGCPDPQLFRNIDDNLYWVAVGSGGTQGLWTLNQYFQPERISSKKEGNIIVSAYAGTGGLPRAMHIRNIVLNGEQHLLITGVRVGAQLVYLTPGSTTDSDDPAYPQSFIHHSCMMAYNINSKATWYIMDMADSFAGTLYWLPASYKPVEGGTVMNKWLNLVVKGSASGSLDVACDNIYTIQGTNSYSNFYDMPSSILTTTNQHWVAGIIQFQSTDFGTTWRKFVHTASIVMDLVKSTATDHKFYLFWSRDEYFGESTKSFHRGRLISLTNFRYYFKHLGSARKYTFGLWCQSPYGWRVKALELEVTQGVS